MKKFYDINKLEVGIDEVGRGCMAGPVVCASVIWPKNLDLELLIYENMIKDSKKLTKKKREFLKDFIEENAIDFSVSFMDNNIIDKHNIYNATHMAMHKSLDKLNVVPELLLVDGSNFTPYYYNDTIIENICIIGGDNIYISIACASILAKVYHDNYITDLVNEDLNLKKYDLENNMGYGTTKHLEAIKKYGISKYHRKTFGICKIYNNCG